MSEEDAITLHSKENIVVYRNVFNPLEQTVPGSKDAKHCYAKIVCLKTDKVG